MYQFLKTRFLLIRLWLLSIASTLLGLEDASNQALKKANDMLLGMKSRLDYVHRQNEELKKKVNEQENTIRRIDRGTSPDVRSSLELINFDGMGEIIWIKVADDRMLRYDVFNQIRDWMRTHGKEHTVLMVTGTNATFETLTEKDLIKAQLRRMTKAECEEFALWEEGEQSTST